MKPKMHTWIILIRGINVGGNNIVPMKELRYKLSQSGYKNVRTYIQTGNVILETTQSEANKIRDHIASCMTDGFGFTPKIIVISAAILSKVIADNPYSNAVNEPKHLHVFFLGEPTKNVDMDTLNSIKSANENYHITDHAAYLHLPDGVWKSKLGARLEKCLGVATTARNWRTVNTLSSLVNT